MCSRPRPLKPRPTSLPADTQTFLTDIQSGKFEPKQDGLLLVPPCLLDWSAPICREPWVAYSKTEASACDKGEWGVNCYSAERNHQTSSCRSWRAVSWALQKPYDRAARDDIPTPTTATPSPLSSFLFFSGKIHWSCSFPAPAPPTGTLYQWVQKRSYIIWHI